ncbi:hypothetical protein [Streptomyces sp. NPDC048188]|uniref:hypothetical protein n=1 Tax=Streptomyces sp. NPDC048188 TaxID=3155749 RepID=UPI0034403886
MTSLSGHDVPRLLGRGPVVRAEHHMTLPVSHGVIEAGYLWDRVHPFPPGAHVVLDCGTGTCMTTDQAQNIGRSLAHVGQITLVGTDERSERGYNDRGLLFGLDAIAHAIQQAAANALEPSK